MATFLNASAQVNYADYIQANVKARWDKSFLRFINPLTEIGTGDESGAISVPIITAVSAEDPADGTLLNNSAAATFKALTFDDKIHPMKLNKSELGGLTPQRLAAHAEAAAVGMVVAMESAVLTQYMAATSSKVLTFAAATANNFTAATPSAAERVASLLFLDKEIAHVMSITGLAPSEIAIVLPSVASPTTSNNSWANVYHHAKVESQFAYNDVENYFVYGGVRVYGVNSTATGWGKWDGGTAGMVIHRNSGAIVFGGVEDTGFYNVGDGFTQRDFRASYASVVLQDTWGEVMNKAT